MVTLDSTFIRSCEKAERHLEVRVGNVETKFGGRQVFGAVAKAESDLKVLINRNLDAVGRTEHTALTAFTDGCSGLRRILADAGVTTAPFLDWFHIEMRRQPGCDPRHGSPIDRTRARYPAPPSRHRASGHPPPGTGYGDAGQLAQVLRHPGQVAAGRLQPDRSIRSGS